MTENCEICGEELAPDETDEGICKNCKLAPEGDEEHKKDEDYIDPGVT